MKKLVTPRDLIYLLGPDQPYTIENESVHNIFEGSNGARLEEVFPQRLPFDAYDRPIIPSLPIAVTNEHPLSELLFVLPRRRRVTIYTGRFRKCTPNYPDEFYYCEPQKSTHTMIAIQWAAEDVKPTGGLQSEFAQKYGAVFFGRELSDEPECYYNCDVWIIPNCYELFASEYYELERDLCHRIYGGDVMRSAIVESEPIYRRLISEVLLPELQQLDGEYSAKFYDHECVLLHGTDPSYAINTYEYSLDGAAELTGLIADIRLRLRYPLWQEQVEKWTGKPCTDATF